MDEHVPRWLRQSDRPANPARSLLPTARALFSSIAGARSVLIHGDLHHHNILDASDRYLAIDPKPMLGSPEFDVPPFLWNPIEERMSLDVATSRIAAFAAAGLDEELIRAWAVVRGAYLAVDEEDVHVLASLSPIPIRDR